MWSENKIKTYRRKLKKLVKENKKFIEDNHFTTNVNTMLCREYKEKDNKKLNFEISVLDKVLN